MSELKPCPFCESKDNAVLSYCDQEWFHAYCYNCGANGPEEKTEAEAALAWSRRAGDEADNLPSK
ncbi:Lar family restriction alleviation protein [Enterobacter ludwigii]|uniref:Lar family restriction alleviation protein n=1 Tax=Enterobacter ludwigii TaxID=299767 RepID=UPI002FF7AD23